MSRGKEVLVGLVIVAALAVGVAGTLWLQGTLWSRNTQVVEILAEDVGQLMEGNDVKFRGVVIGRVDDISVEPGGQAVRVVARVDRDLPLPEDPVAVFAPQSTFGDWQVELGPRSRFPGQEFMDAPPGEGVVPGYALPDMSRLTATADQISRDIATITERIEVAFTEETASNIAQAIDNIEGVSRRLSELVEGQASAVESMGDEVLTAVREVRLAAQSARRTLEGVDSLITRAEADSILEDSRMAARNLRTFSDSLALGAGNLASGLARADSAFARINRIASSIEAGEGTLGRLVTDTTFLATTQAAMAEIEALLSDFRENPRRYINLSIF